MRARPTPDGAVGEFVFASRLPRVVFGAGALRHLPRELEALGIARALVLSTPGQRALGERVAALLGARSAGVFAQAAMHVPAETARVACDEACRVGADGAVVIAGVRPRRPP
jgi:alcohol dehydrogenase class IV